MNKLEQIWCGFKLKNVKESIKKNVGKIELAVKSNNYINYNHYRLEQLRLMSCRGYLENKLSWVTN